MCIFGCPDTEQARGHGLGELVAQLDDLSDLYCEFFQQNSTSIFACPSTNVTCFLTMYFLLPLDS